MSLKEIIAKARADLIADIQAFQERYGMPDSTFGRLAMGDPTFVYLLRKGRVPGPDTIDALNEFMRNYRPKQRRNEGNGQSAAA